jgi:hypothetical protein
VCYNKQYSCLVIGLFRTLFIYKVCILVQLIDLLQFLIVRFHGESPIEEEMCLVDSCITNSIHREIKYFQILTQRFRNILTITGRDVMIVGSG